MKRLERNAGGESASTWWLRNIGLLFALPYVLVRYPVVFPLGLYAALIPFDDVMELSMGGTVTRYLGILVILAFGANRLIIARGRLLKPNRAIWGWLAFLVLAGTSALWAIAPEETISSLLTIIGLFLIYLLVGTYPFTEKDYSKLTRLIIVGGAAAAIFLLAVFLQGTTLSNSVRAGLILGEGRAADPNQLAASLILPLLLSFGWAIESRAGQKVLAIITVVVIVLAIILTGSRGGVLGAVIALLLLFWRIRHYFRRSGLITSTLSIAFVVSCVLSFTSIPYQLLERFSPSVILASRGVHRFFIWRVGLEAFLHRPLIGYGYTNFPYAYDLFQQTVPGSYIPHVVAHSIYVQSFVELGLIGGLLLLFIAWQHWRLARNVARQNIHGVLLEAAFVGILAVGATLGCLYYKYFWLALSLIMILAGIERKKESYAGKS